MPTKLRTDKVADSLSPLVTRVAQDDELRAHAKTALDSAKAVYSKVQSDGPRKAAKNKAVTDDVMKAASELRLTAERLTGKSKRKSHKLRKLILGAIVAGAAAVGLKKVLHRDEDEFDYES
ncbi:MAG TPA: hypothetical protein VGL44_13845 [Gaiellales bacterium]|jgi:hypothetical protein